MSDRPNKPPRPGEAKRVGRRVITARACSRRAFTLIELSACLVILALLTTTVGLSLTGPQRSVELQDVVDQLVLRDRQTREHARRFNRTNELVFDIQAQTIRRTAPAPGTPGSPGTIGTIGTGHGDAQQARTWPLPRDYRLAAVHVPGAGLPGAGVDRQVGLVYSPHGHSPTYAVHLQQTEGEAPRQTWLIVAGLSGQSWQTDSEAEVRAMLDALAEMEVGHGG